MAAYAALVSVMQIIETIQNHPRLDNEQLQSLTGNITFLQEFLEAHSIDDDDLESRIADAAYAAEDVIESHIVDRIEASTVDHGKTISSADFHDGLHKVIEGLDLIRRDMTTFAKKAGMKDDDDDQLLLHNNYSLRRSHPSTGQDTAEGLDDVLIEVMNKLTSHQSNRRIIPIAGMGGIGKTTLASNIYVNPVVVQYFDFRGWATISQDYNSKEILLDILLCLNAMWSRESLSEMGEDELGLKLYKSLCGRRYLIVLDDIWSIEAWDKVKTFFPDNNDGSAIMLTTRLSNLAFQMSGSCLEMNFLDEDKSWNLFCKTVFGEESFPLKLEDIGKKIVENCKGLPLSIVVVGGLLAKSKRTREYWLYIAGNLNSIVNSENDKRCLKILHLSYNELPVHLKPCFLYMGVYPEDCVIDVPNLMRLWVTEGFLKPINGKCLEIVAKEYFNDLVSRNLILVHERGDTGEITRCKVHDLLLDVCVIEAQKHKFLCVTSQCNFSNPQDVCTQRRIVVRDGTKPEVIHAFVSHGTLLRSLTCKESISYPKSFNSKLLRVYNRFDLVPLSITPSQENTREIVNCRYISNMFLNFPDRTLPSSILSLWNLQTLYVDTLNVVVSTSEIWKMSQLRHVQFNNLNLLDPPPSGHTNEGDEFVLENLQTLSQVRNFKFSEDAVKRIPNINYLSVYYVGIEDWSSFCLNNLFLLINLESFWFETKYHKNPILSLTFPHSLKDLILEGTKLDSKDLGTKIGSLPHLQALKLYDEAIVGPEWVTVDGQFRSLKYLMIYEYTDLKYWRTESSTHFPCLEHLYLHGLRKLKEIPSEIGETLKSIEMWFCRESAVFSAKEILTEQEDLGNEGLHVKVKLETHNPGLESLAAPNFIVEIL